MPNNDERSVYIRKISLACCLLIGCYIIHFLIIKVLDEMFSMGLKEIQIEIYKNIQHLWEKVNNFVMLFVATMAFLIYSNTSVSTQDFLLIFVAYLITKFPELDAKPQSINYGKGMACSFFEGYLLHIIPSNGATFVGFEENIRIYESRENVVFPVKKLFIIITKSLYCPPDLKQFNKKDEDLPYLEACKSLEDQEKDVAGVKNRIYRNSAYKIHRNGLKPVYIATECATPLHTLHRALEKKVMHEVLGKVNTSEIVRDFCTTLETLMENSPDCRGNCELVYFDDTDPNQNLAEVLLKRISEIEPKFEQIINNK